ncbi:MAG: YggS family pyridoxal phosphate-dependent enzyme [Candidatus Omnitrophica bacterium]|nr:YggS family pyridoxal phosphate-dependent enzyme [Candidatus Omnitrophota bacterium]
MIAERIAAIRQRLARACERSGRAGEDVTLVCVTKEATIGQVIEAIESGGVTDIGENRVQEAVRKQEALRRGDIKWHMIGHLQSNKVKKAVEIFDIIHSVDTVELAGRLDRILAEYPAEERYPVFIEVNAAREESKYGFSSDEETIAGIRQIAQYRRVAVTGLMTMAPFNVDPEASRPYFSRLRRLRDTINTMGIPDLTIEHLSMGMSQDFEVAVEEGATMVRVGSAIFK